MRLLPKADGNGRVPAVEVLVATRTIKDCILEAEKTKLIPDVIAQGALHYGMQTFDQSLFSLFSSGLITYEEALRMATNPDDFVLKTKGIESASDLTLGLGDSSLPQTQTENKIKIDKLKR
jgi:twitching motility protein PilT